MGWHESPQGLLARLETRGLEDSNLCAKMLRMVHPNGNSRWSKSSTLDADLDVALRYVGKTTNIVRYIMIWRVIHGTKIHPSAALSDFRRISSGLQWPTSGLRLCLLTPLLAPSLAALVAPSELVVASSAAAVGEAADAFDQTPSTYFRSAGGAAWLRAESSGDAWRIDRYSLSVYGLHSSLEPYVPRSWRLWCHARLGSAEVPSTWVLLDNRTGAVLQVSELMEEFVTQYSHAAGCTAVRFEFDNATVLADVYLHATWIARDACYDRPFVDAYGCARGAWIPALTGCSPGR